MVSVTFSADDSLNKGIKKFSWINWSEVARDIFLKKLKKEKFLERAEKLLANSELTDEDIDELSKKSGRGSELKKLGLI